MKPFELSLNECLKLFESNATTGLSDQQAKERLKRFGHNAIPETFPAPWWRVFIQQFASPLIYILILASILIFFLGDDKRDAFIILGLLCFNAVIGTIQEGKTRSILSHLKQFVPTQCIAIRNGERKLIKKTELVPGDIIVIQEGQRIPADARLLQAHGLRVDQAALTGESVPASKNTEPVTFAANNHVPENMVFMGTFIHAGHGLALVTATGIKSQMGALAHEAQTINTDVPLRRELDRLASILLLVTLGICFALLVLGLLGGLSLRELLVTLTALFICVVPEGLPVVLTLVLVRGIYRMAHQRVLVKNMQAVEGLGRVQAIVIDKTGTLTRNEMIVSQVYCDNAVISVSGKGYFQEGRLLINGQALSTIDPKSDLYQLALALQLLNHADITYLSQRGVFDVKGDPTEAALLVFSKKTGVPIPPDYSLMQEIPFGVLGSFHAGLYQTADQTIAYITGSPEELFARAKQVPEAFRNEVDQFLLQGLRVVVVGMKKIARDGNDVTESHEQNLKSDITLLGICGIEDSIRPEVAHIVRQARLAGLRIIMATGDHLKTALSVARSVGIFREGDEALEACELSTLSETQLSQHLKDTTVFARVSAHDKVRIVNALHKEGLVVAMTGDGINDVAALVSADIGIAMGAIGTEVAKEASDLILLDDSFVNIINAIEQGRHIFYTLRRVILYFFATNFAEILIIFFAFISNLFSSADSVALPLVAAQILWLNLITDGFLDVALSFEPQEKGLLWKQEWSTSRMKLIDASLFLKALGAAVPMAVGSFWIFTLVAPYDLALARTMALVSMACFQWFQAWSSRSETRSLWSIGLFTNPWLIAATAVVVSLQLAILYVPFLQDLFHTVPLTLFQWIFMITVASSILWLEETRKWILSRIRSS